ncbi:MAG TPA: DUF5010 domain-containing protein [Candidatus Saccharimonadales bacterium]|nr:DUF5010 domain-containing protein [Candidatus Saccharimonadales bacterium]
MRARDMFVLVGTFVLMGIGLGEAAQHPIPPAFGPYLHPSTAELAAAKNFKSTQRVVGTYYFYWYDAQSETHIINGDGSDGLTDHPPTLEDFSWKSVAWHRKQLLDMETAGIDVALMTYWGAPSEHDPGSRFYWSNEGLKPLVEARDQLVHEGHHPPALGLFYDTSTLENNSWGQHIDLTTDYGRQWFYATVRDFFSSIPARHWAMIDNKPIVLMYAAAFAKNYDQSFIDYTKAEFPKDFSGKEPFIAPQDSWHVKGGSVCVWGGALGFKRAAIGELGPGYDHSAVLGRTPLVVQRENGKFYESNWEKFLRHPSNFVMLETWSEFHEGTEICESREYGRQYIDLTRKYTRIFKLRLPSPALAGKFARARRLDIVLGAPNREAGLHQVENDDGETTPVTVQGSAAIKPASAKSRFIYFVVDDSFKWSNDMRAKLEVEYFDAGPGRFSVQYDGNDLSAPFQGAYTWGGKTIDLTGSQQWKRAEFDLRGARFWNSENRAADFRLDVEAPGFCVRRVALLRE